MTAKIPDYCRLTGSTEKEFESALEEFMPVGTRGGTRGGTCNIFKNSHGDVTIVSRRIVREEKKREDARLRKQKERLSTDVTQESRNESRQCHREKIEDRRYKIEKELKAETTPVDNSTQEAPPQPPAALSKKQKDKLAELTATLQTKRRDFNSFSFIGHCLKENIHPEAQILALQRLLENYPSVANPWAYCCNIVGVESGNFNERDFHKAREKEGNVFLDILENLKNLQGGKK